MPVLLQHEAGDHRPMNKPFRYSFDPKCMELAEHFLPSQATDSLKKELAQHIQDAVEDFCGAQPEKASTNHQESVR